MKLELASHRIFPCTPQLRRPVAFVETENGSLIECAEDKPLFSFGANGDGSAGTNFIIHRPPPYVSRGRTVVHVKTLNDPARIRVLPAANHEARIRVLFLLTSAVPTNLDQVMPDIPLTPNGDFDVKAQREVVERYEEVMTLTRMLEPGCTRLQSLNVGSDLSGDAEVCPRRMKPTKTGDARSGAGNLPKRSRPIASPPFSDGDESS